MAVKIYDTMTTASDGFPLAYAEKINVKRQDGSEDNLQNLFNNGELSGGGSGTSYIELSEEEYLALSDEQKASEVEYRTYDTGRIFKRGVEFGKETDISTKQDNLNQVKFTIRRNSVNEPRYCMIASSDLSQNLLMCEPYRFKGIFGSSTESVEKKSLIDLYVSFREGAVADKVMKGYADSSEAFDYVDLIITVDETENRSYAYVDFLTSGSMCSGEITVPVLDAEKYMTFADSFELVSEMQGTELCRMSDYAKIITNIDDETASETSVWSSQKTSDEIAEVETALPNIKKFASPSGTTRYITISGATLGDIEVHSAYAGKYMFTSTGTKPIFFGVSTYLGYTLTGWAWSSDKTKLYLRVSGQRDFVISAFGSDGVEISDMTTTAPTDVTFNTTFNYNAYIDNSTSENTSTYSSAKIDELNANRQVKTFDNTNSTTEKWYKICSAITGGIGCNIKLTASRADSTATVQYFSVLFRDSRYRYTSSYISRERTVYESMLIAEYSTYIIADANNDIWVHVPSYGKAIIEIDTRAITIDGTAGTPVKDYVYSSFEHQYDGRINDSSTGDTNSTWSSSKIASEISQRFPNLSIPSTKALKITRNSIFSAFIKVMDVHGNLFTLQCGDQDNRFYVIPSYIGTNLSVDITKFVKEATACYLYSNTYSMYVLEVIGDVSYSVIDKTAIPSTATETTITQ